MVQIIQENPRPSTRQRFAQAFADTAAQGAVEIPKMLLGQQQIKKENEALKRLGIDVEDISDPELRKSLVSQAFKQKTDKREVEKQNFTTALDTLKKMKEISDRDNIGRGSQFLGFFGGETARDRAEFAQLGTSLIPLVAAGVPIRNQKEFEEYKKVITNPSATQGEREGAIKGLEQIFSSKLENLEEPIYESPEKKPKKIKFNPKNPEHKAKFEQLKREFKDDRQKINAALAREFEI